MIRDTFYGEKYLQKTGDWGAGDSPWKAQIVYDLYRRNGLHPQTVIDAGCGTGLVLEHLLQLDDYVQNARGYDISTTAIQIATTRQNPRLSFRAGVIPAADRADLLLMLDVVEHVEDYYGFLESLRGHARYFVFHIPLDLCCRTVLKPHVLLSHRESVGHLHYWSEEMVWWMLRDCGYKVLDYQFTRPVIDTARAVGFRRMVKKTLRNASYSLSPSWSSKLWGGYSLLILAKLQSHA